MNIHLPAGRLIIEDGIELNSQELEAANRYLEASKVMYQLEWQLWELISDRADFQLYDRNDLLKVRKRRDFEEENDED